MESIAFCKGEGQPFCVSCGIDNNIFIYNMKEFRLRQKVKAQEAGGFTKLKFSEIDPCMLYCSSTLGDLIILDVRNGDILRKYKGHAAPINDFLEVPEHKLLVTAGDDFNCNVYDLSTEPDSMKKKPADEEMKAL